MAAPNPSRHLLRSLVHSRVILYVRRSLDDLTPRLPFGLLPTYTSSSWSSVSRSPPPFSQPAQTASSLTSSSPSHLLAQSPPEIFLFHNFTSTHPAQHLSFHPLQSLLLKSQCPVLKPILSRRSSTRFVYHTFHVRCNVLRNNYSRQLTILETSPIQVLSSCSPPPRNLHFLPTHRLY